MLAVCALYMNEPESGHRLLWKLGTWTAWPGVALHVQFAGQVLVTVNSVALTRYSDTAGYKWQKTVRILFEPGGELVSVFMSRGTGRGLSGVHPRP